MIKAIAIFMGLLLGANILAQTPNQPLYHIKFVIHDKSEIDHVTRLVSIDNVSNDTVYAYANESEFDNFKNLNIPFELIPEINVAKSISMANTLSEMANWDKYPTYEVYQEMMNHWATQYPNLCVLEEIGTLLSGRKILAIKISDHPNLNNENEPKIFLSSSMHGDEIGGYVISLRLIDHLLSSYNSDNQNKITQLINQCEIWINPLTNPDGTYYTSNATVNGAIRYNANLVDLNRNFPDPDLGANPDGNPYQPETQFLMNFAAKHKFSLGANFHAGVEVVNYPWDTWSRRASDDIWWKYVGGNYRDSAQINSPTGYFTSVSNGLTNGYDWYRITGGLQDYLNYFHRCREFTLEISTSKLYSSYNLPNLWNYNRGAIMGYISEALYGVHGNIIDVKGNPIISKIEIVNYDADHSEVYSDSINGFFTRYLKEGTYTFKISAEGYADALIEDVSVIDGQQTYLKQILNTSFSTLCIDTTVIEKLSYTTAIDSIIFPIVNCGNIMKNLAAHIENYETTSWISLKNDSLSIAPQEKAYFILHFENSINVDTTYFCNLIIDADSEIKIPITINFVSQSLVKTDKTKINHSLTSNSFITDSLIIGNYGNSIQKVIIKKPSVLWLKIIDDSIILNPLQEFTLKFEINSQGLSPNLYSTTIDFSTDKKHSIPTTLIVDSFPIIEILNFKENISIVKNSIYSDSFLISNKGGGTLNYTIDMADENLAANLEITPSTGILGKLSRHSVELKILSEYFKVGNYTSTLKISSFYDTITLPLKIAIDTLPVFYVSNNTVKIKGMGRGIYKDSILIRNDGGGMLEIIAKEKTTNGYNLLSIPNHFNPIAGNSTAYVSFVIDGMNLLPDNYSTSIDINDTQIPINFTLIDTPKLKLNKFSITHTLQAGESITDTLILENNSINTETFIIEKDSCDWFETNESAIEIGAEQTYPLVIYIISKGLQPDVYAGKLTIKNNSITRIPITAKIITSK